MENVYKNILLAQKYSDAAKNSFVLKNTKQKQFQEYNRRWLYHQKLYYILKVLVALNKQKKPICKYFVKKTYDQNGYKSILVYFFGKYKGENWQMSFHTPFEKAKKLKIYLSKGNHTYWKNKYNNCGEDFEALLLGL